MSDNNLTSILNKQIELCQFLLSLKNWQFSLFNTDVDVDLEKLSVYFSREKSLLREIRYYQQRENDYRKQGLKLAPEKELEFHDSLNELTQATQFITKKLRITMENLKTYFEGYLENNRLFKIQHNLSNFSNSEPSLVDIYC